MPADELTEEAARDLLHQAADSIDVAPGIVLRPAARPRWPLVAAAAATAAVAAVTIGTSVLADRSGRTPDPASPPRPPAAEVVPSVFGLTVDDATARLVAAGLRVTVDARARTCETPTRALGTDPEAGDRVTGQVVLVIPKGTDTSFCTETLANREQAWGLLDLLSGRPSTLTFTDSVRLRVDGSPEQTLTADQAADPSAWQAPGALATLTASIDAPGTTMSTRVGESNAPRCGYPDPADLDEREALSLVLFTATRRGGDCPIGIDLYRTDGAVDTVVVATTVSGVADTAMPDLVDLTEDEARSAVDALGTDTQVFAAYRETGCEASGLVGEQQPGAGRRLRTEDSVVAIVYVDTAGCGGPAEPTATQEDIGRRLIGFADTDGSGPPPLADEVDLFVGNGPVGTFTRAELADPDAWRGCPAGATTYAEGRCPTKLLGGLQNDAVNDTTTEVSTRTAPLPCGGGLVAPALPDRLTALTSIFLQPEQVSCVSGYRLQLVLDEQDRIAAVNMMWESP